MCFAFVKIASNPVKIASNPVKIEGNIVSLLKKIPYPTSQHSQLYTEKNFPNDIFLHLFTPANYFAQY